MEEIFKSIYIELIVAGIASLVTASPILLNYIRKRQSWYTPEFDGPRSHRGDFDVVTSSVHADKPEGAPENSKKHLVGDVQPLLIATKGRRFKTNHYTADEYRYRLTDNTHENIMSFGGEVGNHVTAGLLDSLHCPLRFHDYSIVDGRDKDQRPIVPVLNSERGDRVEVDYGIIVKACNQFDRRFQVYIFAGIHKPGTRGVAMCILPEYTHLIKNATKGMKQFVALVEIDVIYYGFNSSSPNLVRPVRVLRAYSLPGSV